MKHETTYEIRSDNAEHPSEWAVFALHPMAHARRVAVTTNKAEAEAALIGLRAGEDLLTTGNQALAALQDLVPRGCVRYDSIVQPLHDALTKALGGA